jgi:hypothetical protein
MWDVIKGEVSQSIGQAEKLKSSTYYMYCERQDSRHDTHEDFMCGFIGCVPSFCKTYISTYCVQAYFLLPVALRKDSLLKI